MSDITSAELREEADRPWDIVAERERRFLRQAASQLESAEQRIAALERPEESCLLCGKATPVEARKVWHETKGCFVCVVCAQTKEQHDRDLQKICEVAERNLDCAERAETLLAKFRQDCATFYSDKERVEQQVRDLRERIKAEIAVRQQGAAEDARTMDFHGAAIHTAARAELEWVLALLSAPEPRA